MILEIKEIFMPLLLLSFLSSELAGSEIHLLQSSCFTVKGAVKIPTPGHTAGCLTTVLTSYERRWGFHRSLDVGDNRNKFRVTTISKEY